MTTPPHIPHHSSPLYSSRTYPRTFALTSFALSGSFTTSPFSRYHALIPFIIAFAMVMTGCAQPHEKTKNSPNKTVQTETFDTPWNIAGPQPHLVAHYMPWFEIHPVGEPDNRTWKHWRWDGAGTKHDPENIIHNGQRDIATVTYPLIGPYNSHDPDVVRYHFQTARNAGITAMVVIWYGPPTDSPSPANNNAHEPHDIMFMLLDQAQQTDMRLAICYEEKLNWPPYRHPESREQIVQSATDDLTYLIKHYASHPAYLRREGKPAIFQFNYWGQDTHGPRTLLRPEWQQIIEALPERPFICRQNLDRPELYPPLDAAYMWIKPDPAWVNDFNHFKSIANRLQAENKLTFLMPFIAPGFDDTGVNGWGGGPRQIMSSGLAFLEHTMAQAQTVDSELIQIATWNDWQEGTAIEPSVENGYDYLNAIETWYGQLTGRSVDLDDNESPYKTLQNSN